jgi:DNA-binding PadR family transcriptional regulator
LNKQKPLTAAALQVLLAIGPEQRHGYAIMGELARITDGVVRMGPGTLYGTLKRLLADGLVEETSAPGGRDGDDPRRRYYRLTDVGRMVVRREVSGLDQLMKRSGAREWATGGSVE